jgi:hypothetical protein
MAWFAIRSVFHFLTKPDGVNVFEERIVCFEAETSEAAHEKAYIERQAYASENGFTAHPHQIGYEQDGDPLIDGYELWSDMFESTDSLEDFYSKRYDQVTYKPARNAA